MRDAYERVPLMFRSQINSRCQIQRLVPNAQVQQAQDWADEWVEAVTDSQDYQFSPKVEIKSYQITWRFITNSGQDEGVIRPVIGAKGFPYFPGSSMKGAFWRSCPKSKREKYCGYESEGESHPGILRFHGGYPTADWSNQDIVDVVHPQEDWQLKSGGNHSAFIQISLYQPELTFGISSKEELSPEEWQKIWQIWEKAIAQGIGTRVSAGYGQVKLDRSQLNSIISVNLKGQGLASQLINKEGEFRANMFKAALRGHTMRLLGGITDAETAERITKKLWGGFAGRDGAVVGELGIVFDPIDLELDNFSYTPARNSFDMPIYKLNQGKLDILAMGKISDKRKSNLQKFLVKLIQFSLLLGGFGKSCMEPHQPVIGVLVQRIATQQALGLADGSLIVALLFVVGNQPFQRARSGSLCSRSRSGASSRRNNRAADHRVDGHGLCQILRPLLVGSSVIGRCKQTLELEQVRVQRRIRSQLDGTACYRRKRSPSTSPRRGRERSVRRFVCACLSDVSGQSVYASCGRAVGAARWSIR